MPGLIDAATAILAGSQERLAVVSQNVAHVTTPGYKRQTVYSHPVAGGGSGDASQVAPSLDVRTDFRAGSISDTGGKLDFAISGRGFFKIRDGDHMFFSRQGTFRLNSDGAVVTPGGYVLQQAGGGDLVLESADVLLGDDGVLLDKGRLAGRIAVFEPFDADAVASVDGAMFKLSGDGPAEVDAPRLRQGSVEAANTTLGDEMVAMMSALRQAETGSRLIQTYDELLGRAITSFGQGGR